jgi:hypothetical protein
MSLEDEALTRMRELLHQYGLQTTLKVLGTALDDLIKVRGKSSDGLVVLEVIKGLHTGYCRRHEEEESHEEMRELRRNWT